MSSTGRERSLLHGDSIIFIEPLGEGERLLFHLYVLHQADQIMIDIDDAGDGGDDLLFEDQAGGLLVVFRYANVAAVDGRAEAAQQRLGDGEAERRHGAWVQARVGGVGALVLRIEGGDQQGAWAKALLIAQVAGQSMA